LFVSRRSVAALATLVVSLALAAPAGAATLTRDEMTITFTAAPGIENDTDVTTSTNPPPSVYISTTDDPVAYPLPNQCADVDGNSNQAPAGEVLCSMVTQATLDLGDLDDVGDATGPLGTIWIGGPGNDRINGGAGDDELNGGAGDDSLSGHNGSDLADGGEGDDLLSDTGEETLADTLRGGPGADVLITTAGSTADVFDGGPGIDSFTMLAPGNPAPPLYVNLSEGIAGTGGEQDTLNAIEDVSQAGSYALSDDPVAPNPATITGTAGVNLITAGPGADTINPGAGNDLVSAGDGGDVIDTRDGYEDRVTCGNGNDSVQADTLDSLGDDCETVTRTDAGNANDKPDTAGAPDDKAPAVAFAAPASSAVLSTTAPTTITATATDDIGIARVVFSTGERTLCTDTVAPYTCDYRPTAADVGRDTLVAIAVDTSGQTASAVRVVIVPRFKATGLGASTSPKRDRRAPYTFTTAGKLALPTGVTAATGCSGTIDISFKAGTKTVSSRRVALRADCSYSSKVTFRLPRRLNPRTLSVVTVFSGNSVLDAIRGKRHTVRPR
jgi:hypothetical protein